jgi:hypothetical protein
MFAFDPSAIAIRESGHKDQSSQDGYTLDEDSAFDSERFESR